MKRFKNILYYVDARATHQPTLQRAVDLAIRNRGRLTVVGVLDELPRELCLLLPVTPPVDLQDMALQDLRSRLERLVEPVRQKGLRLVVEVLCGKPFLEVIRAVLRHQHDLVMMTAEGKGGLRDLLFGSTSSHLMRKCPCPVWVLKPGPHKRFLRILAAVDPDPIDEVRNAVNTQIMELASSLARVEGTELHVVHAWSVFGEEALRHWHKHLAAADVDRIHGETEAMHERLLRKLLTRHKLTGVRHKIHLVEGEAALVIPKYAAKRGVDLIVMGTLARRGIEGLLIGNTAEAVLRRVNCSVLTVKPDGFVTPVKLDQAHTLEEAARQAGLPATQLTPAGPRR